jgi:hypothetical protein
LIPLTYFDIISGQNGYEKEQRAITQKIYREELSFLHEAFILDKIYPPMKFHVDISKPF